MLTRPPRAPRTFTIGRAPHRDRGVVALHRLADRYMAGPAMPTHQLPGVLHGVPDVEQLADQRLDPAQRPALIPGEPVRQRPFAQLGLQPRELLRTQPLREVKTFVGGIRGVITFNEFWASRSAAW
jgi:hypothetical protein